MSQLDSPLVNVSSSKRARSNSENRIPRKRKRPLTASMPGPMLPVDFNICSDHNEPASAEVLEHFSISEFDESNTPFMSPNGMSILPQKSLGHVRLCKVRNKLGHISFASFKIYFSTSSRPLIRSEQTEVNAYDDLDTSVFYSDYKLPKNVFPHCHYIGHVVHHNKPGGTPEVEIDKRHCWVRVICAYCEISDSEINSKSVVDMLHTGNNEKFRRHLQRNHPEIPMDLSYQTIATRLHSSDFKQLLTALMRLVVYERLPFSFVASPNFIAFCRLLNPAVQIPSTRQFGGHLASFIQDYLRNHTAPAPLIGFPSNPNKHVVGGSVLMDAWEAHGGNHLLCIQFQYADNLFQKRARVLALKEIEGSADASTVCRMANHALETHALEKLFYFTMSDSGSNIVCAFRNVSNKRWLPLAAEPVENLEPSLEEDVLSRLTMPNLDPSEIASYMQPTASPTVAFLHCQFRCNSHLCNLIVGAAINDKQRSVAFKTWLLKVMSTLTCIRRRHHLQEKLRTAVGRGARPYIEVRWNTVHDTLEVLTTVQGFTTVRDLISQATAEAKSQRELEAIPDNLEDDDFQKIQETFRILNCLARPSDILQSDFSSAPDVLAQFALSYKALTCIRPSSTLLKTFRETIMKQFILRVKPLFSSSTLVAATVLQPSQKHLFRWMAKALPDNPFHAPTPAKAREILEGLVDAMPQEGSRDDDIGISFEVNLEKGSVVDQYFAEPVGKQTYAEFWLSRRRIYPQLSKLARIFDGLPASTGKVERTFSLLGLTQGDRRNSLSVDRLEQLLLYTQADRGHDEIIPSRINRTDKDSNYNEQHSCLYMDLLRTGSYTYKPLLNLPNTDE